MLSHCVLSLPTGHVYDPCDLDCCCHRSLPDSSVHRAVQSGCCHPASGSLWVSYLALSVSVARPIAYHVLDLQSEFMACLVLLPCCCSKCHFWSITFLTQSDVMMSQPTMRLTHRGYSRASTVLTFSNSAVCCTSGEWFNEL